MFGWKVPKPLSLETGGRLRMMLLVCRMAPMRCTRRGSLIIGSGSFRSYCQPSNPPIITESSGRSTIAPRLNVVITWLRRILCSGIFGPPTIKLLHLALDTGLYVSHRAIGSEIPPHRLDGCQLRIERVVEEVLFVLASATFAAVVDQPRSCLSEVLLD